MRAWIRRMAVGIVEPPEALGVSNAQDTEERARHTLARVPDGSRRPRHLHAVGRRLRDRALSPGVAGRAGDRRPAAAALLDGMRDRAHRGRPDLLPVGLSNPARTSIPPSRSPLSGSVRSRCWTPSSTWGLTS